MKPDLFYATAFAMISAVIAVASFRLGGSGFLLLWPALSFAIVAAAYCCGRVDFFGKSPDGRRHRLATAALLPYLTFAHLVWNLQIRFSRESAVDRVNPSLRVARRLRPHEVPADIRHVIDLTCELTDPRPLREVPGYRAIPILDAGAPTAATLQALVRSLPALDDGETLIHCANGHGRTGLIAAAWLIHHHLACDPDAALKQIQSARPGVRLRPRQRRLLSALSPARLD